MTTWPEWMLLALTLALVPFVAGVVVGIGIERAATWWGTRRIRREYFRRRPTRRVSVRKGR